MTMQESAGGESARRQATVWAGTWVSAPSPIDETAAQGYCVAWVDTDDGERIQAFSASAAVPEIGAPGVLDVDADSGAPIFRPNAQP
jgi:hypothetical protein